MRIKTIILIVLIAFSLPVIGQEKTDNLDFRLGAGVSLLGTGDITTFNYENEINYKLNPYFTSSASLNFGRSSQGVSKIASLVQGNINIYFSTFKNNKRFDFRVGTGLTFYNISDARQTGNFLVNGVLADEDYEFRKRNSFGYSFIIENSYLLTDRLFVGLKLFTQPYFNGDINSGLLFKLGFKI